MTWIKYGLISTCCKSDTDVKKAIQDELEISVYKTKLIRTLLIKQEILLIRAAGNTYYLGKDISLIYRYIQSSNPHREHAIFGFITWQLRTGSIASTLIPARPAIIP